MARRRLESILRLAIWFVASGCAGASSAETSPETTAVASAATASVAAPEPAASPMAPSGSASASAPPYAETPLCWLEDHANLAAGLRPSIKVDYVAIMHERGRDTSTRPWLDAGQRCASATDRGSCELKVSGAQAKERGPNDPCESRLCSNFFVATSGDDVVVLDDVEELRAFLGTIDTPTEALIIAWLDNYRPGGFHFGTCALVKGEGIEQSKTGYVFDASIERSSCPLTFETMEIQITPTGTLKALKSKGLSKSTVCARGGGF